MIILLSFFGIKILPIRIYNTFLWQIPVYLWHVCTTSGSVQLVKFSVQPNVKSKHFVPHNGSIETHRNTQTPVSHICRSIWSSHPSFTQSIKPFLSLIHSGVKSPPNHYLEMISLFMSFSQTHTNTLTQNLPLISTHTRTHTHSASSKHKDDTLAWSSRCVYSCVFDCVSPCTHMANEPSSVKWLVIRTHWLLIATHYHLKVSGGSNQRL